MKDSDLQLCDQTPLHWGWSDDDHDGVMDLAAPPTIDAFSVYDPVNQIWIPAGRAAEPGWTVTITGRNVWDARVVIFGGVPSPRIWRTAINQIAVTVPSGVSGIVTIELVTRFGSTNATFEESWFLVAERVPNATPKPIVFGLVPASGGAGTQVKILGWGLFGPTMISFGDAKADLSTLPSFDSQSLSEIDVTAPAGPAGPVPVIVTTADGSSDAWIFSTFTYT